MSTHVYSSPWVLPMAAGADVLHDTEVVVDGGIIAAVRPIRTPAAERTHFDNAILMPGFVNAHCHLEYTVLRGFLEDVPFFPWIRTLTALKQSLQPRDWLWSTRLGAYESIRGGITTIGDNCDAGPTAQVASELGFRAAVFQEVFGIDHRDDVDATIAQLAVRLAEHAAYASPTLQLGISPHALYTVRPALFGAVDCMAREGSLPLSIHVAESAAEEQLTLRGEGAFWDMYQRRGIAWDVPHVSPTEYVHQQRILRPGTLAVHCVRQSVDDVALLAASGAAAVHCPKSNAKLGVGTAPLQQWLDHPELVLALGTDSALSNNTLDMFEEMRFGLLMQRAVHGFNERVNARLMVAMATTGGAKALGLQGVAGSLQPGYAADMIAVDCSSAHAMPIYDPFAALVFSCRADDVRLTMTSGKVLYQRERSETLSADLVAAIDATRAAVRLTLQSLHPN